MNYDPVEVYFMVATAFILVGGAMIGGAFVFMLWAAGGN